MTNKELLLRYDKFFGKQASQKLLDCQKKYSSNQFIRFNLSKNSLNDIKDFLKKNRVKYSDTIFLNAFRIDKSFFNLSSSIKSLTGEIYIQDLASQIPINCIDFNELKIKFANKKIKILDMAASPGSKTTQLCDLLVFHKIDYHIKALEMEEKRVTKLINNIQKQGFVNVDVIHTRAEHYKTEEKFDIVLLDAPCSGNLIDDKGWLLKRNIEGINKMAKIQRDLLVKADTFVKDDGLLIYSTCSLEIEENEENVDFILKNSKLKTIKPKINFGFDTRALTKVNNKIFHRGVENAIRIMPYNSGTQGFFVCSFKK